MTVQKRIAQINYAWTPRFHSRGGEASARILEKLPSVAVRSDRWLFRTEDKRKTAGFAPNRAWFAWEATGQKSAFLNQALEVLDIVGGRLQVKKYSRVGYRVLVLQEAESFGEAKEQICRRLFGEQHDRWSPMQGAPDDLAVVFEHDSRDGNAASRLSIAPITKQEFTSKHREFLNLPNEVKEDAAYFIDVDMWLCDQQDRDLTNSLQQLVESAEELCDNLVREWFIGSD